MEGFVEAYDEGLDPQWRETLLRITRDRLSLHRHPEAVARALREVPRSRAVRRPRGARGTGPAGARRRQPRRLRPWPPLRGRRGLERAAARGAPDQRGAGRVSARLAGRQALAGHRRLLRARRRQRRRAPEGQPQRPRFSTRWTSRRPDQVSSIAQTLLSTRPRGRPISRRTSSVRSVCDAGAALRPRDPESAVGEDRPGERGKAAFELAAPGEEGDEDVERGDGACFDRDPVREGVHQVMETRRGASGRRSSRPPGSRASSPAALPSSRPRSDPKLRDDDRRRRGDPLRGGRARHARLRSPTGRRSAASTRSSTTTASTSSTGSW